MNRPCVYISGPLSNGVIQSHVANGIAVYIDLIHRGYAPILPHLSYFADPSGRLVEYDVWIDIDLSIVRRCDIVLRLPGESKGADKETAYATTWGIPVVYSVGDLEVWSISREAV